MGVRKVEEQHIRSITQNSTGTYSLSVPIQVMRELGWRKGQKIVVKRQGKLLIVHDWNP